MKKNKLRAALVELQERERLCDRTIALMAVCKATEIESFLAGEPVEDRTLDRVRRLIEIDRAMPADHPGRIIREIRHGLGWTREGLAKRSGVSHTALKYLETGHSQTMELSTALSLYSAFAEHYPRLPMEAFIRGDRGAVRAAIE